MCPFDCVTWSKLFQLMVPQPSPRRNGRNMVGKMGGIRGFPFIKAKLTTDATE